MSELGKLLQGNSLIQYWTSAMEKQVGERLNILLTDPMLLKVYQQFGGGVFRRSSVFHGLDRILKENKVHGKLCFEIGTWNGLTAVVLSRYFDKVMTVDIVNNPMKREVVELLGIKNIEFLQIKNNDEKPTLLGMTDKEGIDFAYLDGNHAADTELDFDITKRCGRVLFHEVWPFQSPVWELVHSLPEHQVVQGGFGLALWDASKRKV